MNDLQKTKADYLKDIMAVFSHPNNMARLKGAASNMDEKKCSSILSGSYSVIEQSEPDKKGIALWMCDPQSIFEATLVALSLGIPIDARQLCYFQRYGMKVKAAPGWRGYLYKIKEVNPTVELQVCLVHESDVFHAERKNGMVEYAHVPGDPFLLDIEKCIGVYCWISYLNNGREYSVIELVPKEEVQKMRRVAKTDSVWQAWWSEMYKKSAIRRATKIPFASAVEQLDVLDNENFDLSQLSGDIIEPKKSEASAYVDSLRQQKAEPEAIEHKPDNSNQMLTEALQADHQKDKEPSYIARENSTVSDQANTESETSTKTKKDSQINEERPGQHDNMEKDRKSIIDDETVSVSIKIAGFEYDPQTIRQACNSLMQAMKSVPESDRKALLSENSHLTDILRDNGQKAALDYLQSFANKE